MFISFSCLWVFNKSLNYSISATRSELFFEILILMFERFQLFFDLFKYVVKTVSQADQFIDNLVWSCIILAHNSLKERKKCFNLLNDVIFLFVSIHRIWSLLIKWERNIWNIGRLVVRLVSRVLAEAWCVDTRSWKSVVVHKIYY